MKKIAFALVSAAALMFGVGLVAQAQQGYDPAISISPNPPAAGGAYTVTYVNCFAGESIIFSQPESTPAESPPVLCNGAAPTTLLPSSIVNVLLPQGNGAPPLGTASFTFDAAPTEPGTYDSLAEAVPALTQRSPLTPTLPFSFTITGETEPDPDPTTTGAPAPPTLPSTGSSGLGSFTGIALGLFAVGAGFFAVAQVRRRQTPDTA